MMEANDYKTRPQLRCCNGEKEKKKLFKVFNAIYSRLSSQPLALDLSRQSLPHHLDPRYMSLHFATLWCIFSSMLFVTVFTVFVFAFASVVVAASVVARFLFSSFFFVVSRTLFHCENNFVLIQLHW